MSILTKIAKKEISSEIVWQSDQIIVIQDIAPIAPIHLLILPVKCYQNLQSIPDDELEIIAQIASVARHLATKLKVEDGYRLVTNSGKDAGQTEEHLHFHFLAGKELGSMG